MIAEEVDLFGELKRFISFTDQDAANLVELGPLFAKHGQAITDAFYENLETVEETRALIEGRVDALKQTHAKWMSELFEGTYDEAYFENRFTVGKTHVRVGLDPKYVEGVMTFLRLEGHRVIFDEIEDRQRASELYSSLVKILDLDLSVINISYAGAELEKNLTRLSRFTGMSMRLLQNCIKKG